VAPVHFDKMLISRDGTKLYTYYKYRVHRFSIKNGNLSWDAVGKAQRKPLDANNPVVKEWFDELCVNPASGECYWTEGHSLTILAASGYRGEEIKDDRIEPFDRHLNRVLVHPQGQGFLAGYRPSESIWAERRMPARK
jgi:hypothetical protein